MHQLQDYSMNICQLTQYIFVYIIICTTLQKYTKNGAFKTSQRKWKLHRDEINNTNSTITYKINTYWHGIYCFYIDAQRGKRSFHFKSCKYAFIVWNISWLISKNVPWRRNYVKTRLKMFLQDGRRRQNV